jgi:hypothetical protein
MYLFFVPRLLICDPISNDSDGRHIAGPYPNVPSMGMTEWWVHCFGSHFASPKSEICFIKNTFISFYEITSHWFNHTQYLWSTMEFKSFFCIADSTRLTVPFLWFEKGSLFTRKHGFTWGSKSSPRSTLAAFMSRWMIRCLQNMCRYCKPLATPTAIFCLKDHSRTFPLFPEKNVIFRCHIVTDKVISSVLKITIPAKTDTVQCRCERPVCAELED